MINGNQQPSRRSPILTQLLSKSTAWRRRAEASNFQVVPAEKAPKRWIRNRPGRNYLQCYLERVFELTAGSMRVLRAKGKPKI
jgi:hypothetical protein